MANTNLNVRLQMKGDSYANWQSVADSFIPLENELCIITVPAASNAVAQEPAILFKVGDGVKTFAQLPFVSAMAADIYDWAKTEEKPSYSAAEISGLSDYIKVAEQDTNTQYKLEQDNSDTHILKLFSKETGGEWNVIATITTADTVYDDTALVNRTTALETLVGSTKVAEQIASAISALNLKDTYDAKGAAAQALSDAKAYTDTQIGTIDATDGAEYSIIKDEDSNDYAAVYHLTKDGVNTGATINVPKDMVVSSGSVVKNPTGQSEGTYIELIIANAASDKLYINVTDLIEYVTSGSASGDMIIVAIDDNHKVTATITDGSVTKSKLAANIQTSLDKADTALQDSDIAVVAKSGDAKDLIQTDNDYLIFNCGTASTFIS